MSREISLFEKILFPVGLALTFFGLYLIYLAEQTGTVIGWLRLSALFLWMILLFVVIQSATAENMKEELMMMQKEHIVEVKLLRDISRDHLEHAKSSAAKKKK